MLSSSSRNSSLATLQEEQLATQQTVSRWSTALLSTTTLFKVGDKTSWLMLSTRLSLYEWMNGHFLLLSSHSQMQWNTTWQVSFKNHLISSSSKSLLLTHRSSTTCSVSTWTRPLTALTFSKYQLSKKPTPPSSRTLRKTSLSSSTSGFKTAILSSGQTLLLTR